MSLTKIGRRSFMTAGCSALSASVFALEEPPTPLGIPLRQEPLPFAFGALEPYLDAATLKLHYEVCHREHLKELIVTLDQMHLRVGSVSSLLPRITTLQDQTDLRRSVVHLGRSPGPLPDDVQQSIRFHGGAHFNHTNFWRLLAPHGSGPDGPKGAAAEAIQRDFGSVEEFKTAFTNAALKIDGSGWVWLVYRPDGRLVVTTTPNEDNPRMKEFIGSQSYGRVILCLDVWEHAYSPKYQNDRRNYISAWWNVVNWAAVSKFHSIATHYRL